MKREGKGKGKGGKGRTKREVRRETSASASLVSRESKNTKPDTSMVNRP